MGKTDGWTFDLNPEIIILVLNAKPKVFFFGSPIHIRKRGVTSGTGLCDGRL
jgi:hypothetical protein